MKRTHNLGELKKSDIGKNVVLMGWVSKNRDHGGVVFLDLRDRFGTTQIVFDPNIEKKSHDISRSLHNEDVICVCGTVRMRPSGMINDKIPTGDIEVIGNEIQILNKSKVLPFSLDENIQVSENLRLEYRYLDLRRKSMQNNIIFRSNFIKSLRYFLDQENFIDIETPYLYKSTPEGAREFLCPSRIQPAKFYALSQSPQIFKQMLMISGFDRYYQIVKCFRDEDLRSDRQMEFTQVDCEMSFMDQSDIMSLTESILKKSLKLSEKKFDIITYKDSIEYYGSDKPDIRFDLKITDISKECGNCNFKVFRDNLETGGIVNALVIRDKVDEISRKDLDDLNNLAIKNGAKGLAWARKSSGQGVSSWKSPIAKFLGDDIIFKIEKKLKLKEKDIVLFGSGDYDIVKSYLGVVRNYLGKFLNLYKFDENKFVWIIDFPLFNIDNVAGSLVSCHHPFTSPKSQDLHLIDDNPQKMRASAYDLVLNGHEIAGGSIRIHDPNLQIKIFNIIGMSTERAKAKFGFLIDALSYGAPPHGGIAFGLDRICMILTGSSSIRDVISFPKNQKASCPLTGAPSEISNDTLRDLHIKLSYNLKK